MKQDIQISVLGIQNAGSEPEAILTKTTGTYSFEKGFYKIQYCELDENGTATDNFYLFQAKRQRPITLCPLGRLLLRLKQNPITWL